MKKLFLLPLLLSVFSLQAQNQLVNVNEVPLRFDTMRTAVADTFGFSGRLYKIKTSKNYRSSLLPRVMRDMIVLVDKEGKVQNNTIISYDCVFRFKGSTATQNCRGRLVPKDVLPSAKGEKVYISKIVYVDLQGTKFANKVGEFEIEVIK